MFPAVDAHNHLWGEPDIERIARVMDAVGVAGFCDVAANAGIAFADGDYVVSPRDIGEFFSSCSLRFPGRFYCFTMATFAKPAGEPLYDDPDRFVGETLELLHRHAEMGARGLKILMDLGLKHRDATGRLVNLDDPHLWAIWAEAGKLGLPVLMHQADPSGFFDPVTPANEHYETLREYPSWSFADPRFPRKEELLRRRDSVVAQHPGTTFLLAHVANAAEDLSYVAKLLDANSNVFIDFSSRLDELGRQPYTTRELFLKYSDRIVFGTDMPADTQDSQEMYRSYFRFLETYDESFYAPHYDGTFERARWPICGIGLPESVLRRIYYGNILRIVPGLREELKDVLPHD